MSKKILNDNELNQVVGGSGSGYLMYLNKWYQGASVKEAGSTVLYYYFCKSDAGNGNYVFEEYKYSIGFSVNKDVTLRYVRDVELSPAEYADFVPCSDPRR